MNLRKLHEAASPAPWHVEQGSIAWMIRERPKGPQVGNVICVEDVDLIAALRNAAPYLLDVVDAARAYHGHHDLRNVNYKQLTDALAALDRHLGEQP